MLRFDLATASDDAQLRRLLRDNPMDGDIRLTLEREPNAFLASTIAGEFEQIIVARNGQPGRILGMGNRSVMRAFVNGRSRRLGYLSQLRVDRDQRGRKRLLAGGYRLLRDLHADRATPFYISTIVADNRPARRILEASLKGFPTYRPLDPVMTLVLPVTARQRRPGAAPRIERGTTALLPDIVACLERNQPRYQFAPQWTREDLESPTRTRGLAVSDFFVARRHGHVVGCVARWDQRAFKQAVVRGYSRNLRLARPMVNALAPLVRFPRLPAPGTVLRNAFLTHLALDDDEPTVLRALLAAALHDAGRRGLEYLTVAFAERNPLTAVVQRAFRQRVYRSILYAVFWSDGAADVHRLDGRIPHVEAGLL